MAQKWFTKGVACSYCGQKSTTLCSACGACINCGGCRPGRCTKLVPLRYKDATFARNSLPRAIGVEYEIAHISTATQRFFGALTHPDLGCSAFSMHRDGSVLPSQTEWVTAVPIVGDTAASLLAAVSEHLQTAKNTAANNTCGFHVHIDACKEQTSALRRFLWLYLRLEEEIYSTLIAPERAGNTACLPLSQYIADTKEYRNTRFDPNTLVSPEMSKVGAFGAFVFNLYGLRLEDQSAYEFSLQKRAWARLKDNQHGLGYDRFRNPRYCGMNIHAFYHHGSIEWRMKEQTTALAYDGGDDLYFWPLFCGHFTHLGLTLPEDTLAGIHKLNDFVRLKLMPADVTAWLTTRLAWRAVHVPPPLPQYHRGEDILRNAQDNLAAQLQPRIHTVLRPRPQRNPDIARGRIEPEPEPEVIFGLEPEPDPPDWGD